MKTKAEILGFAIQAGDNPRDVAVRLYGPNAIQVYADLPDLFIFDDGSHALLSESTIYTELPGSLVRDLLHRAPIKWKLCDECGASIPA